jgi:biopolymer transport protein ExbB/TolQ
MPEPQIVPEPTGQFETVNSSALAVSKKAAGAGVIGLLGFFGLLVVAGVFFVTENFFISLLLVSIALLVYATGPEIGKLLLSSFTVFFSSKHLTAKAAMLQETLATLEERLTLRRDRAGELKFGPIEKGMKVKLPDNALVRDLVAVQEKNKGYDYAEYVAYSYYVDCHELYDHSASHLDFVSGAMPLMGLMGNVLGLISMFDSLGSVVTVEQLSPQLALALKTTLYGALYSTVYKISATRFEQRLKGLGYDFDTLCRGLKVLFDNKAVIEVQR